MSLKYRAEIDGLRTIAVIPVIFFHLGYDFVKGGFYGVDVFFVISGYLITQLLVKEIESGNFSMYRFWIRRVKRLLPLLLTVISTTLLFAVLFLFKPVVKDLSNDIFPALFSYFNFHALLDFGNYWGKKANNSFLLHTWSLSVEEQFYLIYPVFLFFVYKYFKRFFIPLCTITLLSFALFLYVAKVKIDINSTFYLLPTRMWELSMGGICGFISLEKYPQSKFNFFLPFLGLALIFYSYVTGSNFSWILAVVGASLMIISCSPNDIFGKTLSTKVFVFIGKLSYSLYLWHWVVIIFFQNFPYQFSNISPVVLDTLVIVLTFVLSYLTYTFIEKKTRYHQDTHQWVLAGVVMLAGVTFYFKSDLYRPCYDSKYHPQVNYSYFYDISPNLDEFTEFIQDNALSHQVEVLPRLDKYKDAYKTEGIITNKKNGTPKMMLLGDSHGVMWAKMMDEIAEDLGYTLSSYTSNGSKPFFNLKNLDNQVESNYFSKEQRTAYAKSITDNINKWNPELIILVCRWTDIFNNSMHEFLTYLDERDIPVLLLTQPPVLNILENKNASQYFTYLGIHPVKGYNWMEIKDQKAEKNNAFVRSLSSENVFIYDVYKEMTKGNKAMISLDREMLYFDDDHLSYYGTYIHKENISTLIQSIIASRKNAESSGNMRF